MSLRKATVALLIFATLAALTVVGLAGCSSGQPSVIVFMGKSSPSYADTKAMVDKAQKKYGKKVTFKIYDYDSPTSAAAKKKYYVDQSKMNPTIIITNAQGQIKQTYMGKPMEDELMMTIASFIPGASPSSASSGASQPMTEPGTPIPGSSTPGQVPSGPVQTVPAQP